MSDSDSTPTELDHSAEDGPQGDLRRDVADVSNEVVVQSANLFLVARRVLLTSLGALAMTIDESAEFVSKLVERGEIAETDLSRMVSEYMERSNEREEHASEARRNTVDKATVALADSVEIILGRLNVPTRTDIDELSRKIGQLNDKVLSLKHTGVGAQIDGERDASQAVEAAAEPLSASGSENGSAAI